MLPVFTGWDPLGLQLLLIIFPFANFNSAFTTPKLIGSATNHQQLTLLTVPREALVYPVWSVAQTSHGVASSTPPMGLYSEASRPIGLELGQSVATEAKVMALAMSKLAWPGGPHRQGSGNLTAFLLSTRPPRTDETTTTQFDFTSDSSYSYSPSYGSGFSSSADVTDTTIKSETGDTNQSYPLTFSEKNMSSCTTTLTIPELSTASWQASSEKIEKRLTSSSVEGSVEPWIPPNLPPKPGSLASAVSKEKEANVQGHRRSWRRLGNSQNYIYQLTYLNDSKARCNDGSSAG
ncbi:unnamed protein product [Protopolystoma xenopodis]|uniref:Uncharacterized protein n=1 Tax=Protopolystoma xenopodis TaxID=117903 RepID=A0A3S5BEA2_9PLAT|nr:unnamed protein product [Protopolystoma xenopodis]